MGIVEKLFAGIGIILLLSVASCMRNIETQYELVHDRSKKYPIYYCKAPFGIIYTDESGSFLGWSTDLTEIYLIKYLDGNELKTVSDNDSWTKISIVVDGEFYLEEVWHETTYYSGNDKVRGVEDSREVYYWKIYHIWIIHLPQLPSLNQTISTEWTFIGS